ncbi:undecaprenyldiphospho-muramoylpentapeptide beta-N-acetylglucosaminyltransferase [Moraxella caviae]|uniref:UDP-N-acetylglucosamine--N-acetylmuramyl-(pentapeptide) pyrophosphoryl-undecaprenol N-acetylglucosamine transferase n=1 Tax=Moraxella caviae TaxID=34060 RepID=A0A1S9ZYQ4_9GAMM|nr:undecaprenyldiphospho-muramoylpentapeptide beta-N-acetylglucosaminyltransferase [Moraxella caviae]OOR88091.1 undecaprenyldiphospho-muramoylpentapeptide beta-N-acetylglucosaminyltransferase [Moraxella caviae]STZ09964.1 UDP-N-acetylglucosamine--N-acetylmuramyl-(pentapeptide) pyrophosphoryl-undecaprenol N-acetylglucosamine transferase [Moraxella caviae]VEW11242.1 UDP-N-acetylglucosamine--N-acetylmuramyl-(pentapeptide) pyrophosphoryl-undecaprenol N-acetylglucosamine transferase [Moraxella caviae]
MQTNILMMAAGTGGHVFPALAVADELAARGAKIHWLGTPNGMENELVAKHGYTFHAIDMKGLRGNGVARLLKLPVMLFRAVLAARAVIKNERIDAVVGFGGYVTAPGGLAAKLCKVPLIIHEQNAIVGMSNKNLARQADKVLQAFDGAFDFMASSLGSRLVTVGNPVRADIENAPLPAERYRTDDTSPLKVLVMGGSLGAQAINNAVVELLKSSAQPLSVRHQCGKANHQDMLVAYSQAGIDTAKHTVELLPFIDDVAAALNWADVVICRAGALTVTEIQSVGVPAIFVPLPHAVDDHQTANAKTLTDIGAAILLPQSELSGEKLAQTLAALDRSQCLKMAQIARTKAKPHVAKTVADIVAQTI